MSCATDTKANGAVRRAASPRPKRQAVLVVHHPDGHAEAYSDDNIDVCFARVPASPTRDDEELADECFEMMLPPRFRALYWADKLRACGTTRPMLPSTALQALATRDFIRVVNKAFPQQRPSKVEPSPSTDVSAPDDVKHVLQKPERRARRRRAI